MNKQQLIWSVAIIVVVIAALAVLSAISKPNAKAYASIAQCLSDKGVIFYGAYWCPHCAAQKAAFGDAVKLLPYHECQNPQHQQVQSCNDAGIQSYPTWVFPDGTRLVGEQSPVTLAQKAGCPIPAGLATSTPATASSTGAASPVQ